MGIIKERKGDRMNGKLIMRKMSIKETCIQRKEEMRK